MKRLVSIAVVFVLAMSIASFAGEHNKKKMNIEEKTAWLAKELKLSDTQQASLKPILEEQQKQMEAVWKDASLNEEAKMAKKKEIKSDTDAKIKALLNTEQQEKYATLMTQPKKEKPVKGE